MRRAAKIDGTQTAIVQALRRIGVSVEIIGKPVDLLTHYRGSTSLMEVKNRAGKNALTKDQIEFIARWPGIVHVVHDEQEAIRAMVGDEALR